MTLKGSISRWITLTFTMAISRPANPTKRPASPPITSSLLQHRHTYARALNNIPTHHHTHTDTHTHSTTTRTQTTTPTHTHTHTHTHTLTHSPAHTLTHSHTH